MNEHHPSSSAAGIYPGIQSGQMPHVPLPHNINQFEPAPTQMSMPATSSLFNVNFRDQQFWKGALLGAAVTLVVTNESLQKGIMKTAARLYGAIQGGVQEMKEKFEDVQAELHQETQEK